MFNLHIIALGKIKESDMTDDYLKRLKPYAKIEVLEIPEEPFREHDDQEKIKEKEAEKILKHLPEDGLMIALHERGKEYTSQQFAKFLEEKSTRGEKITFLIGGPLGWHTSILDRVDAKLSLSKFTFPHQLTRIILLEQLYRAATILAGKKYHY